MANLTAGILAIVASALVALAGIGVVRFPALYARMHAATKAPTARQTSTSRSDPATGLSPANVTMLGDDSDQP